MAAIGVLSQADVTQAALAGKLNRYLPFAYDPTLPPDLVQKIQQWGHLQTGAYTIDLPGLSDVFRFPISQLNNPDLKRERLERFKTHVSPVPEVLRWIPRVINFLDDIQDIVLTGLLLARPFLRGLPARFIPYVGWGLIALDAMNVLNALMGTALTGPLNKSLFYRALKGGKLCVLDPKQAFANFLKPLGWRRWLGAILQGAQALYTLTGSGLMLGSLMSALSDTFWGSIRALSGAQVIFRDPPPSDPAAKAARVLSQASEFTFGGEILSWQDHLLVLIGLNLAVEMLAESGPAVLDSRLDLMLQTEVPVYTVWEPSSRLVLRDAGINPDDAPWPLSHQGKPNPTFEALLDEALGRLEGWEELAADIFPDDETDAVAWWLYAEAGTDIFECLTGLSTDDIQSYPVELMAIAELAAMDIWPPEEAEAWEYTDWLRRAIVEAQRDSLRLPLLPHWQRAAVAKWGRYRDRRTGALPQVLSGRRAPCR